METRTQHARRLVRKLHVLMENGVPRLAALTVLAMYDRSTVGEVEALIAEVR